MANELYSGLGTEQQVEEQFSFPAGNSDEINLEAENQQEVKANERTLFLIGKAIEHVTRYDSLETGLKLMGRAYSRCPSVTNKRAISRANASLKHAIKSERWARSKRRRRHVDEHTRKKNVDAFLEKVASASALIQQENDRRNKRLFSNIKQQFVSDLPLQLTKGYTLREAHVTVMTTRVPTGPYKIVKLEGGKTSEGSLFLIERARVIGVNREKYPNRTLAKATAVAKAKGVTVYESPVARPSHNVVWYLIQDFGANVGFVSFADSLELGDPSSGSYESYIRSREATVVRERVEKTARLRGYRQAFFENNAVLLADQRALRAELDETVHQAKQFEEEFRGLTTVSDADSGLRIDQIARVEEHLAVFLEQRQREGATYLEAKALCFEQRFEARTAYFDYRERQEHATALRRRLEILKQELAQRRQRYAEELGLVSLTKLVEI